MRAASKLISLGVTCVLLSACGGQPTLRNLSSGGGAPEEFSIIPNKPLEAPTSLSALPEPTPGAQNLVDATPKADAIAALGGNPNALAATAIPGADSALVTSASRYGVPAYIRATTSAEDEQFRRRKARFTNIRLFRTDRYADAYKRESLDARSTLEDYRRADRRTPTAPPSN
jgi:hypothetical protein